MTELQTFMSTLLMCDPEDIPPQSTALSDLEGWDSMQHVLLIVNLEKHLSVELTSDDIRAIVTLEDVATTLSKGADS